MSKRMLSAPRGWCGGGCRNIRCGQVHDSSFRAKVELATDAEDAHQLVLSVRNQLESVRKREQDLPNKLMPSRQACMSCSCQWLVKRKSRRLATSLLPRAVPHSTKP